MIHLNHTYIIESRFSKTAKRVLANFRAEYPNAKVFTINPRDNVTKVDRKLSEVADLLDHRSQSVTSRDTQFTPVALAITSAHYAEFTEEQAKQVANILHLGRKLGIYVFVSGQPRPDTRIYIETVEQKLRALRLPFITK